jgi:hypothetical protein
MHSLTVNTLIKDEFIFDEKLIEHSNGVFRLKSQAVPVTVDYDMSSDALFTYDNAKLEFVTENGATIVRLKDKRPHANMFYSSFNTGFDANYGNGVLAALPVNSPTITNTNEKFGAGALSMVGGAVRYVDYAGEQNLHWTSPTIAIAVEYRPEYSGTPAAKRTLWCIGRNADYANYLELYHSNADGHLKCLCYNSAGVQIADWDFGVFAPVATNYYNIELNMDLTGTPATRLFVDGVQLGATKSEVGNRSDEADFIRLGSDKSATAGFDGYIDEFAIYTTIQHTADFTAPVTELPQTIYVLDMPSITTTNQITSPSGIDSYLGFMSVASEYGANVLRVVVSNDNGVTWQFWDDNTNAWAVSSGAPEASDLDDISTNITSFPVGTGLKFRVYFISNGATTPELNDVDVVYNTVAYPTTNPKIKLSSAIIISEILTLTPTVTVPATTAIKYTVVKDNTEYWWNTAAGVWEEVINAYVHSNDLTDILNNIDALFIQKSYFNLCMYLHSDDGLARPAVSGLALTYNANAIVPEIPERCRVFGTVLNGSTGEPQANATVTVKLKVLGKHATGFVINTAAKSIVTGPDGKWEFYLIDSVNQVPMNNKYQFSFVGEGLSLQEDKIVPDQAEAGYTTLL